MFLIHSPLNPNVVLQSSNFPCPLWISKLSRLTGLRIFSPGHSWNRSGLRATNTALLQPLQTKPALHNCHLNAKHFSLGWSVPFVHTFLRKVVLLEHNILTCFTACWAWAAGIVSYLLNLHRIINRDYLCPSFTAGYRWYYFSVYY